MAWNRPSAENQQKKPNAKAPSAKRGIIAGVVIVVALGALCLYFFSNGEATSSSLQKKERGLIKEVTPAAAPTNRLQEVRMEVDDDLRRKELFRNNPNYPHPGVGARIITNAALRARGKAKVFKYRSEREIANLLTIEPGMTLIGERHFYGERFERDLEVALNTPIEYDKNDDQQTKELKIAVQQTKDYLKEQQAKGVDICKTLNDTYHELQDLGIYFMNIKSELAKIRRNPESTDSDVEDAVSAANMLLEKKGISPKRLSETAKIFLRNNQNKSEWLGGPQDNQEERQD